MTVLKNTSPPSSPIQYPVQSRLKDVSYPEVETHPWTYSLPYVWSDM